MPRRAVSHATADSNVRECHRMLQIVMQQDWLQGVHLKQVLMAVLLLVQLLQPLPQL